MAHRAETVRCPGCGVVRFGPCPFCFPELAEADRARRLAAELAAEEQRAWRWCEIHRQRDRCAADGWTWAAESAMRNAVEALEKRRELSWVESMAALRRRYAQPG